jgi:hypothetical protein
LLPNLKNVVAAVFSRDAKCREKRLTAVATFANIPCFLASNLRRALLVSIGKFLCLFFFGGKLRLIGLAFLLLFFVRHCVTFGLVVNEDRLG